VVPPTRPVAITTTKIVSAPQALAPKRRRSFVGEPRPGEKGRGEPAKGAPAQHRKRGRTFQDEPTQARPLPAAEKPRGVRMLDASSTFDDLDEDTRVLSTKGSNDLVDQAFERLRASPPSSRAEAAPVSATVPAPVAVPQAPAVPAESILAEDTPDERTVVGTPAFAQQEAAALLTDTRRVEPALYEAVVRQSERRSTPEAPVDGVPSAAKPAGDAVEPAPISSSGAPTERPPAAPATTPGFAFAPAPRAPVDRPAAAAPAHRRFDTIPSVRVAVLATGTAGEVRLIALDGADDPPPGAALAILVPIGASDAEAVARLFQSQD
jgi:hypothetical protein